MQYRTMRFQKTEDRVSLLGFGCMRFPKTESGAIDRERAGKMLDTALKAGVNYIDTAYPYHDGESEPFLGRILAKYARDSYYLATKLPVWLVNTAKEAQAVFDGQLDRLQVSYVDYYLFHALNRERWEKLKGSGIIEWAEQLKQEGKIRHLGFSFHDDYEVFREIITYRQWDFCQIQYNYMDRDIQAGDRGYELARKMGIPMIVMEPVKGGMLSGLPKEAQAILEEADPERLPASWALRWVGSHPGVKLVLSGMSSEEQLEDNIRTFSPFVPIGTQEEEVIGQAAKAIRARLKNSCTACRYCMPCPAGVDIPGNFAIWNEGAMYDIEEKARKAFKEKQEAGADAGLCIQCGKCEKVCPQGIGIRKDLADVVKDLSAL